MPNYEKFHFSGQKANEQIILMVRRHWFNILEQFFIVFLMILLLLGSWIILPLFFPGVIASSLNVLFNFLRNLFGMFVWITFFLIWIDYYFDVWIITNKRVVNIEQKGLFNRQVSELELARIQDITTEVTGVIPTMLNYGDVFIQTAGENPRFIFRQVSDPYGIKDTLMNLQKKRNREEAKNSRI
ncbi:MAG: hypothetical protein CO140_04705 [Candidatus Moranbacteria bacterium CG_4_9_14_3_um_filter_40_7]|nr:MAG: hypothetical protein COX31_02425 [Candidatus Moranbacteria bacterium CG23_combo_of_CG06-09_8_20_14_all_40_16]PIU80971.1 MAG: hypothetical protein COS71_00485 [Candidatus Moranbacteria bacterium CG06_land_8_20_14_3_00_40_12]PJA87366.1 MAG: hypothetical protein CO140_04705 [Candidatus Moranbacteria bacterium CG_4_9_14_3_um_filter_40_7]